MKINPLLIIFGIPLIWLVIVLFYDQWRKRRLCEIIAYPTYDALLKLVGKQIKIHRDPDANGDGGIDCTMLVSRIEKPGEAAYSGCAGILIEKGTDLRVVIWWNTRIEILSKPKKRLAQGDKNGN